MALLAEDGLSLMQMQQIVVLLGMVLVIGMCIYPPWQSQEPGQPPRSMGYAPIWQPPVEKHQAGIDVLGLKVQMGEQSTTANQIDLMRLAIQCGIVAGVTAVFTRLLPSHRSAETAAGKTGSDSN